MSIPIVFTVSRSFSNFVLSIFSYKEYYKQPRIPVPLYGIYLTMSQDPQARTVLKEAVDAVVNSFAKHTHGYGRGMAAKHCCFSSDVSLTSVFNELLI